MHKAGVQSTVIERKKSDAIKSGIGAQRVGGPDQRQPVGVLREWKIADDDDGSRKLPGRRVAGFYTSDVFEVAFDDLEIER